MNAQCYTLHKPLRWVLGALLFSAAAPAWAQYGTGAVQQVPVVAAGAITLDGVADEAAWASAPEVDLTQNWNSGFYDCAPNAPGGEVDIVALGKLLYTEGALYVYVRVQDYQAFYFGPPGKPYVGEYLLVGVDLTHAGDNQVDDSYSGWPDNAPNAGPTTYKISGAPDVGITSNWGFADIFPADSGWVAGKVFVDNEKFEWGVEMAIYGDEVKLGNQIGFNIGGAAGHEQCAIDNDDDYAYYSWQALAPQSAGGDVMNNSASFGTLSLVQSVAAAPSVRPDGAALRSAYPNPFQDATTLAYSLVRPARVQLAVYDVLGREVATLVDGVRPAGDDRAAWRAENLPAGLYLVQLRVDGVLAGMQTLHLVR